MQWSIAVPVGGDAEELQLPSTMLMSPMAQVCGNLPAQDCFPWHQPDDLAAIIGGCRYVDSRC
jgi:hypothetical protein